MVNKSRIKERLVVALRKQREPSKDLYEAMRCNAKNIFRNAIVEMDGARTVETVKMQILDGLEELVAERVIHSGTCTGVSIVNGDVKASIHIMANLEVGLLVFNCTFHDEGVVGGQGQAARD